MSYLVDFSQRDSRTLLLYHLPTTRPSMYRQWSINQTPINTVILQRVSHYTPPPLSVPNCKSNTPRTSGWQPRAMLRIVGRDISYIHDRNELVHSFSRVWTPVRAGGGVATNFTPLFGPDSVLHRPRPKIKLVVSVMWLKEGSHFTSCPSLLLCNEQIDDGVIRSHGM